MQNNTTVPTAENVLMARLARVVLPGVPHHVVQRGIRRQRTFFSDADYRTYLTLLSQFCRSHEVDIWCYALMPNHVHLVLVPSAEDALTAAVARTHQAYSSILNRRMKWRGCFWQGRYNSFPTDERHLLAAVRYILLNPVRARLVRRVEDWPWSSWEAHLRGKDDIINAAELDKRVPDWGAFIERGVSSERVEEFRLHERTGRPLGDDAFLARAEHLTGRVLRKRKPGPSRGRGAEGRARADEA